MNSIADEMQIAVNTNIFPGAVLLVSHKDEIVFYEAFGLADIPSIQLMQKKSIFDLASLTKPLATALCAMKLVEMGVISVDQPLSDILREEIDIQKQKIGTENVNFITEKSDITLDQLLRHTSGLPAHRPFYKKVIIQPPALRKTTMRHLILKEPLVAKPGKEQIYSDLGYMLIAWLIEKVSGLSLYQFTRKHIYQPLEINDLFFTHLRYQHFMHTNHKNWIDFKERKLFVSTELCPWRKKILRAEVHDENAWSVGGVDGHAGLFGTAFGIWRLLIEIMHLLNGRDSHLVNQDVLKSFLKKKGEECIFNQPKMFVKSDISSKFNMVAGFDTPSLSGSSAGKYFSPESIGHLGFTGTSFWMDPVKSLIVILLSNRVHPSSKNQKIKAFRPIIHDLIFETIF